MVVSPSGNCDEESSLSINRSNGYRQVAPIYHFPDDALIDKGVDPPQTFASSLYTKDMKMASISLQAESYGLALGKNRTAALVSRQDYCQKVPSTSQQHGQRSCQTEGMSLCNKCLRYGAVQYGRKQRGRGRKGTRQTNRQTDRQTDRRAKASCKAQKPLVRLSAHDRQTKASDEVERQQLKRK